MLYYTDLLCLTLSYAVLRCLTLSNFPVAAFVSPKRVAKTSSGINPAKFGLNYNFTSHYTLVAKISPAGLVQIT